LCWQAFLPANTFLFDALLKRFILCCILFSTPVFAATKVTYNVLLAGNQAGIQTTEFISSDERQFSFEYTDRGRGPKIQCRMILNQQSIPVLVEISGNDYLKSPIEERFHWDKGKASWESPAEAGEKALDTGAFYISVNGVPEEIGVLAAALLASPEKTLALLPEGEAHIEKAGTLELKVGEMDRKVGQYVLTGLGFLPVAVWLDDDNSFFASVDPYFTVIREGWESSVADLQKAQEEVSSRRFTEMTARLSHRLTDPVVIEHANLFDSETGESHKNMTIVISGNRIQSVGSDGETAIDPNAQKIDAQGQMVMPGLWDMHVHIQDVDGLLNLANGVTTVRDLANDIDTVMALKKKFEEGALVGPRVILAGIIDGTGPFAGPTKMLVSNEQEARAAVDQYAKLGYEQIKIYSSVKPELVPFIIEEAHKNKLRVSGHVPAFMTAEEVVKLGFDEIQHVNFLFLNFLADTVKDTRTPLRFTAVAENAAKLDLNSQAVKDFFQLLKQRKTVIDPTVNVFENLFTARQGVASPGYAAVADRLPPQVRRGLLTGGLPVPEGMDQQYRASFQALLHMVKRLYDEGIPIVAGTDSLAGFSLHRELELYAQAGIPPARVLQLATLGCARIMKKDSQLGSVSPGKLADLILIDGDPLSNISDVRKVRIVIKNGVMFRTSEIDSEIGIKP